MKIIAALNGLGEYLTTKDEALAIRLQSILSYLAFKTTPPRSAI